MYTGLIIIIGLVSISCDIIIPLYNLLADRISLHKLSEKKVKVSEIKIDNKLNFQLVLMSVGLIASITALITIFYIKSL